MHPTTPDGQTLYTLPEAARELQKEACRTHGHSWDIVIGGGKPIRIQCECGLAFAIGERLSG